MSEEMLRSYEELRAEFSTACAELEKERERREKAESGYCEHRCQSLGIAECMNPEWENDRAERDRLREALDTLQRSEAAYRRAHDVHGDGALAAGRAWDIMRRAGDKARAALFQLGGVAANQARAALKPAGGE